jgi:hypothetical protein
MRQMQGSKSDPAKRVEIDAHWLFVCRSSLSGCLFFWFVFASWRRGCHFAIILIKCKAHSELLFLSYSIETQCTLWGLPQFLICHDRAWVALFITRVGEWIKHNANSKLGTLKSVNSTI